jgi:hypothetical protein
MLEFKPGNEVLADEALQTTQDLDNLLNSCYDVMANAYYGNYQNLGELLSYNLSSPRTNQDYNEVFNRATIFFNGTVGSLFGEPYIAIYRANTLLNSFDLISDLKEDDKLIIEAEAKLIRAMGHFDLVNLFAQPYGYTSDNSHLGIVLRDEASASLPGRSSVQEVYDFVLEDLSFAAANLPDVNGVYGDRFAAYAMLARVYFQMNDFQKAAEAAEIVINEGNYVLPPIDERWSQTISSENIFTLVIASSDNRTNALSNNYRSDNNDIPELYASREYVEGLYGTTIPTSDLRSNWLTKMDETSSNYYYNIAKFNELNYFNIPYLHYTEVLLIHAESLAELGTELFTAVGNINEVRLRAGLNPLNESSSAEIIINAARVEREKEFLGEGRIVFDLKRRGAKGEDIMIRNALWDCNGMVLQFPISENTSNFIMNPTGGCN